MKKVTCTIVLVLVIVLASPVMLPSQAEANCFSTMLQCYKDVDDWLWLCVTGNWWNDAGCGAAATVWQLGCSAEYATCIISGGN